MRAVLVIGTIVGFLFTAGGLVAAYVSARRQVKKERNRVGAIEKLTGDEIAEQRAANDEAQARRARGEFPSHVELSDWTRQLSEERVARYERQHAELGSTRASWASQPFLAAHESVRVAGLVLDSTRSALILAGVGLVISTAASVGSLFL
ncbi:hypothetical protein [Leifsonia xyli]|uniref:hypothetical protein n=1 Tax=Leifsonia xyli TaxID=1575 RepID=UPI003D66B017